MSENKIEKEHVIIQHSRQSLETFISQLGFMVELQQAISKNNCIYIEKTDDAITVWKIKAK